MDLLKKSAKINRISSSLGEKNDCSVRAISIACDVKYETAHTALRSAGRKDRVGAYYQQIFEAVESISGKRPKEISPEVWRGNKLNALVRSSVHTLQNGSYLVFTSGHVFPVVDGVAYDWCAKTNKRIVSVYRVQ